MRQRFGVSVVAGAALAFACQALKPPPPPVKPTQRADVANVVAGDGAFAFRLYGALKQREGNIAFSPAGVRMALTMAWTGAAGETADELGRVLGLAGDPTLLHQSHAALLGAWKKPPLGAPAESFTLRVAQGFFVQTERQPSQPFLELLARHYAATFSPKDFAAPDTVRDQVNRWVGERTNDRLPELFPEGSLDSGMELVLVSALAFETPWLEPFDPAHTVAGKFQTADGKKVNATLLSRSGEHRLSETPEAQVVELEYAGDGFVFDLILPRTDFAAFEAALDEKKLDQLLSALTPKQVTVTLPRFTAGETLDLAEPLQKIGIHAAFTRGKADFSGMTGTRQLYLSKLPHRIALSVDDGKPAGTTSDGGVRRAPEVRGVDVRAARPFLYLVRDRKRSLILGMGRLATPGGA